MSEDLKKQIKELKTARTKTEGLNLSPYERRTIIFLLTTAIERLEK
jgi:hypothetical protein